MAQTQEILNEGIKEIILLASGGAASAVTNIVCMTDSTPCTAAKTSTHAAPADTLVTDSGLASQAIDTVSQDTTNTTGDTLTFDHVFTATGTKNVSGIQVVNSDGDCSFVECCFNAILAFESTDTLTIDGALVLDQA